MNRLFLLFAFFWGGLIFADTIPLEVLSVDSRKTTPVFFQNLLRPGATYKISVQGFYYFNSGFPQRQADAEYVSEDGFGSARDIPAALDLLVCYGSPIGTPYFNPSQNLVAQDVSWGSYNPQHVYSFLAPGNGGAMGFVVSDHWLEGQKYLWDNSGILTVSLQEVPVPAPSSGFVFFFSSGLWLLKRWRMGRITANSRRVFLDTSSNETPHETGSRG